jgi:hypothetical protein
MMVRCNSWKPYWKEKFMDGLSSLFAHKVKDEFVNSHTRIIDYENLTYGDLFSTIKKTPYKMCIDKKNDKATTKKAKYEMGNFCEQFGLPPIAPSWKKKKKLDKFLRKKPAPYHTKKRKFNMSIEKTSHKKPKQKILLILLKENISIVVKLGILLINVPNRLVN